MSQIFGSNVSINNLVKLFWTFFKFNYYYVETMFLHLFEITILFYYLELFNLITFIWNKLSIQLFGKTFWFYCFENYFYQYLEQLFYSIFIILNKHLFQMFEILVELLRTNNWFNFFKQLFNFIKLLLRQKNLVQLFRKTIWFNYLKQLFIWITIILNNY